jgi:hypothetical protein
MPYAILYYCLLMLFSYAIYLYYLLRVVLSLSHTHRIGYEREGIQHIFKLNPSRSLSSMLDLLQKVFLEEQYVSKENVVKVVTGTARR